MCLVQSRNTLQTMAWMRLWYWLLLPLAWQKAKLNVIMSTLTSVCCDCIHNCGTQYCCSNHQSYCANGISGLYPRLWQMWSWSRMLLCHSTIKYVIVNANQEGNYDKNGNYIHHGEQSTGIQLQTHPNPILNNILCNDIHNIKCNYLRS